jgi:ABC-type nitrate/sulfonate/bicarbonate transport system substrate-binding protein
LSFRRFGSSGSIKIGGAKTASGGAGYIAIEKGYFAAEELDAQLVFFDSA